MGNPLLHVELATQDLIDPTGAAFGIWQGRGQE
jgi:hypothetical protein